MTYALELWTCQKCGKYPIKRVVKLPPPDTEPKCPDCGGSTSFEKVYVCDEKGNILE